MREMVRAHVEMVKTMSERFSSMMEAGASLLRAADGAGITSRKPPEPAPQPEEDEDDDEEEEEENDEQPSDLVQLLKEVMPMIQMYLATKLGGVDYPGAPNVPTPNHAAPPPSAPPPPPPPSSAVPPPATPTPASSAAPSATPPRNVDLTPTPAQMSHISAVQAQLTPAERKIAMTVAMRMPPEARAQWFASLCSRSVDEAAALIRSNLPATARQPESPTTPTSAPATAATPDASATATTPPAA
jgi:hypothetical protein